VSDGGDFGGGSHGGYGGAHPSRQRAKVLATEEGRGRKNRSPVRPFFVGSGGGGGGGGDGSQRQNKFRRCQLARPNSSAASPPLLPKLVGGQTRGRGQKRRREKKKLRCKDEGRS